MTECEISYNENFKNVLKVLHLYSIREFYIPIFRLVGYSYLMSIVHMMKLT